MPPSLTDLRREAPAYLLPIAVGGLGGWLLDALHVPAGWISGAMVATAALAISGFKIKVLPGARHVLFILLGITIGGTATPEITQAMLAWPMTIFCLSIAVVVASLCTMDYLKRVEKFDSQTAMFAAIPGALSYVLAVASTTNARMPTVVIVQTVRVVLLIAVLPSLLGSVGLSGAGMSLAPQSHPIEPHWWDYPVLIGASAAAGLLADRMRIPGGMILGSMLTSTVLHGSGATGAQLPPIAMIVAFVLLGVFIASRLDGFRLRELMPLLRASLGALFLSTVVSFTAAVICAAITGLPTGKMLLAFSPGAFEAMVALAFILDLDPAFVGAMHLARFMLISLGLPVVTRWWLGPPDRS